MLTFRVSHRSRSTSAAPVAKHVAYITRDQEYGPAKSHVAYVLRESEKVNAREDLVHAETGNLPEWAQGSAAVFFDAAEQHERANGRFCTTYIATLPRGLSQQENIALVQDYTKTQFKNQPHVWAYHEAHASDGGINPHIHLVFTDRTQDGIERGPEQFFKRYNPTNPERGGARKDRFFNEMSTPGIHRQAWADLSNLHLERAGHAYRIDPRSMSDRGWEEESQKRLSKGHGIAIKQGHETERWKEQRELRAALKERNPGEEQRKAAQYWESRKTEVGVTDALSHAQAVERLTRRPEKIAAHDRMPAQEKTMEQVQAEQAQLGKRIDTLQSYERRVSTAVRNEQARIEQGEAWKPSDMSHHAALIAEAKGLGLDDDGVARGVKYKEERTRGRGITR